jgi:hypothetical protein
MTSHEQKIKISRELGFGIEDGQPFGRRGAQQSLVGCDEKQVVPPCAEIRIVLRNVHFSRIRMMPTKFARLSQMPAEANQTMAVLILMNADRSNAILSD